MGCTNSKRQRPIPRAQLTAAIASAQHVDRGAARARKIGAKAQGVLDRFDTALGALDAVPAAGSAFPVLGPVCAQTRALVDRVRGVGDVAQDALDMAESVVEATEHLLQLARSCQRLGGGVQAQLERQMAALRRLIDDISAAVEHFGRPGFLRAFVSAAKSAKSFARLSKKLEKTLNDISRTVQFLSLIHI